MTQAAFIIGIVGVGCITALSEGAGLTGVTSVSCNRSFAGFCRLVGIADLVVVVNGLTGNWFNSPVAVAVEGGRI